MHGRGPHVDLTTWRSCWVSVMRRGESSGVVFRCDGRPPTQRARASRHASRGRPRQRPPPLLSEALPKKEPKVEILKVIFHTPQRHMQDLICRPYLHRRSEDTPESPGIHSRGPHYPAGTLGCERLLSGPKGSSFCLGPDEPLRRRAVARRRRCSSHRGLRPNGALSEPQGVSTCGFKHRRVQDSSHSQRRSPPPPVPATLLGREAAVDQSVQVEWRTGTRVRNTTGYYITTCNSMPSSAAFTAPHNMRFLKNRPV